MMNRISESFNGIVFVELFINSLALRQQLADKRGTFSKVFHHTVPPNKLADGG
jgi:hypothetical protein